MINIKFCISIFVINKDSDKYMITEKSFKYLKYLKDLFKCKKNPSIISFLIVGSEKDLSKNLTLKYFEKNEYVEFDQCGINYFNRGKRGELNTVTGKKTKYGYEICKKSNPDLIILMKNNHFISQEWINEVIYHLERNSNSKFFYGIGYNGNLNIVAQLKNNKIDLRNKIIVDRLNMEPKDKFDACLIGIPRILYKDHNMNPYRQTEYVIQDELIKLKGIRYKIKGCIFFNIKSHNDSENVTSYTRCIKSKLRTKYKDDELLKNVIIKRDITIINSL